MSFWQTEYLTDFGFACCLEELFKNAHLFPMIIVIIFLQLVIFLLRFVLVYVFVRLHIQYNMFRGLYALAETVANLPCSLAVDH